MGNIINKPSRSAVTPPPDRARRGKSSKMSEDQKVAHYTAMGEKAHREVQELHQKREAFENRPVRPSLAERRTFLADFETKVEKAVQERELFAKKRNAAARKAPGEISRRHEEKVKVLEDRAREASKKSDAAWTGLQRAKKRAGNQYNGIEFVTRKKNWEAAEKEEQKIFDELAALTLKPSTKKR